MRFGIEDHFVKIQRTLRCEEKIEVLESFRKEKTLHRVCLLFSNHAPERCVTLLGAAVPYEIAKELLAHPQIDSAAA